MAIDEFALAMQYDFRALDIIAINYQCDERQRTMFLNR